MDPILATDDTHDRALITRISRGDRDACRVLYLAHAESLFRFAYSLVHVRDVAEDMVQDLFVSLWQRREQLDIHGSVRGYLFGVIRNRVFKHRRHDFVVTKVHGDHASDLPTPTHDELPDALIERSDRIRAVRAALQQLSERHRTVLALRWTHEMSFTEIGQILGISGEGARLAVAKAQEALSKNIRPDHL